LKGYGPHFAVNAFVLLVIHAAAWLLSFVFNVVQRHWLSATGQKVCYFFSDNLVIAVFFLTSSELSMLAFFQT
jgi:hypothetical protein